MHMHAGPPLAQVKLCTYACVPAHHLCGLVPLPPQLGCQAAQVADRYFKGLIYIQNQFYILLQNILVILRCNEQINQQKYINRFIDLSPKIHMLLDLEG